MRGIDYLEVIPEDAFDNAEPDQFVRIVNSDGTNSFMSKRYNQLAEVSESCTKFWLRENSNNFELVSACDGLPAVYTPQSAIYSFQRAPIAFRFFVMHLDCHLSECLFKLVSVNSGSFELVKITGGIYPEKGIETVPLLEVRISAGNRLRAKGSKKMYCVGNTEHCDFDFSDDLRPLPLFVPQLVSSTKNSPSTFLRGIAPYGNEVTLSCTFGELITSEAIEVHYAQDKKLLLVLVPGQMEKDSDQFFGFNSLKTPYQSIPNLIF